MIDGLDNVLEGFRTGEASVFRDVPDEECRDVLPFRGEQELGRCFAHLADAPGRRLEFQREDRLHGIDNDQRRFDSCNLFKDALEARFGQEVQRRGADGQPLAA